MKSKSETRPLDLRGLRRSPQVKFEESIPPSETRCDRSLQVRLKNEGFVKLEISLRLLLRVELGTSEVRRVVE